MILLDNVRAWWGDRGRSHDRMLADAYALALAQHKAINVLIATVNEQTRVLGDNTNAVIMNANITRAFHEWIMAQSDDLPGERKPDERARNKRAN